ncbi:MAG: hypothetical protein EP343_24525 [Deltaproteobacteria bacterium]|nr:MAG: hypothetical protein EP343_24525 [Deltaproteobacteria bacterium]
MKVRRNASVWARILRWAGGLGLVLGLCACAEAPLSLNPSNHQTLAVPLALQKAHQAYAKGEWKQTALLVKEVFLSYPNNSVVQKNALQLLEKVHEQKPAVPADWKLPKGVKLLEFMTRRGVFLNQVLFHSALRFRTVERNTLKQVTLTHGSGRVVLDRARSVGVLHSSFERDGNDYLHDLYFSDESKPLPQGLYRVKLVTQTGQTTAGWFFIDSKAYSTKSPEIGLPAKLRPQDLADQLRFPSFRSPEFRAGERRTFYTRIVKLSDGKNSVVRELWTARLKPSHIRVKKFLKPGSYRLYAGYREVRKFGPMYLSRISYRLKRFAVERVFSSQP